MRRAFGLLAAAVLLGAAGPSEPQSIEGPCAVPDFFIVAFGTTNAEMRIGQPGRSCTISVINANRQVFQTAALVTTPAQHGRGEAGLLGGGVSVAIRYTPEPGFVGTDRFTVTIEPADKAVIVHVTVTPAG